MLPPGARVLTRVVCVLFRSAFHVFSQSIYICTEKSFLKEGSQLSRLKEGSQLSRLSVHGLAALALPRGQAPAFRHFGWGL